MMGNAAPRVRSESGYIGVTAMGIMLLLMGTSIVLLGSVRDQVVMARESQKYTSARQGLDSATADAVRTFNNGSFDPRREAAGTGATAKGTFDWVYDPATRDVRATGAFGGTDQEQALPLRWLNVGSKAVDKSGGVIYGLAANGESRDPHSDMWTENAGAWAFGLASGDVPPEGREEEVAPSRVNGSFYSARPTGPDAPEFDYALLGDTAAISTFSPNSARPRVLRYSDAATVEGSAVTEYRSHLNLQFDEELLRARTRGGQFSECLAEHPISGGLLKEGFKYCAEDPFYTLPDVRSAGVVTLVVKGDLNIAEDVNRNSAGQLHIYVDGDVYIAKDARSSTQHLNNVFIYAPTGTCRAESGRDINLRGAMACKTLDLPNVRNVFTHIEPLPDTDAHAGAADAAVYYTEAAGHIDTRTPGVLTTPGTAPEPEPEPTPTPTPTPVPTPTPTPVPVPAPSCATNLGFSGAVDNRTFRFEMPEGATSAHIHARRSSTGESVRIGTTTTGNYQIEPFGTGERYTHYTAVPFNATGEATDCDWRAVPTGSGAGSISCPSTVTATRNGVTWSRVAATRAGTPGGYKVWFRRSASEGRSSVGTTTTESLSIGRPSGQYSIEPFLGSVNNMSCSWVTIP